MNGVLPIVESNVQLVKGLIEYTFCFFDTDIYSAAKTILQLCKSRLISGSIILFDELHSYPSWRLHEYKALQEELSPDSYKFIAFSDYKQGMIEIR